MIRSTINSAFRLGSVIELCIVLVCGISFAGWVGHKVVSYFSASVAAYEVALAGGGAR